MKLKTFAATTLLSSSMLLSSVSAHAVEMTRVQKKLDQFKELNSCTEESRESQFPSVFAYFEAKESVANSLDSAVVETDFSRFHVGFDHDKGEYFYQDIFGKDKHYEQLHKVCEDGKCSFNMVFYPKIIFPATADNADLRIKFLNDEGRVVGSSKLDVGDYNPYAFKDYLIPFDAYLEDGTIVVRKLPSEHEHDYYTAGLHIGLSDVKHEIDVVVNKQQIEEGVLLSYSSYSDVTYLGVYVEPSDYDDEKDVSKAENKIELYDVEKPFFEGCEP